MAATKEMTIDQGSEYLELINITKNSVILDLTGYSIKMMVRNAFDSATPILSFATPVDIVINAPLQGQFTLTIPAALTTALVFTGDRLENVYDIEITSPTNTVTRVREGAFIVSREVTRP